MQRSRARLACLILALVVSGCMRTAAPVAGIDNGSLDALAYGTIQPVRAAVAAATEAPLWLLIPLFVVAGVLSMSWNGLAYAAAAEAAGTTRTGAALGFQQTLLGVVVAAAPPAIAGIATHSWRAAFIVAAAGPAFGVVVLLRLSERARTRGT